MEQSFDEKLMQLNSLNSTLNTSDLIDNMKQYNLMDVLQRISTMYLIPSNQNKILVLDELVNAIIENISDDEQNKHIMSDGKFKQFVNEGMGLPIAAGIDPAEEPFVYRILLHNNFLVFSGIFTNCGYNLQTLLNTVLIYPNDYSKVFKKKCHNMANFVLQISTQIAKILDYDVDKLKSYDGDSFLFFNSKDTSSIIPYLKVDLDKVMNVFGEEIVDLMCSKPMQNYKNHYDFYSRPFIKDGNELLILSVSALPVFLINYILFEADSFGYLNDIIEEYNQRAFDDCIYSIISLDCQSVNPNELGINLINNDFYKEALFKMGDGSKLVLHLIGDDGNDYCFDNVFDEHSVEIKPYGDRVKYFSEEFASNIVYSVFVVNCVARRIEVHGLTCKSRKALRLTPFELRCVATNEKEHSNFLLRYINSRNAVQIYSPYSDIYNISSFVANGYSFYMSDEVNMRTAHIFQDFSSEYDYVLRALKKASSRIIKFGEYVFTAQRDDEFREIYYSFNDKFYYDFVLFSDVTIAICIANNLNRDYFWVAKSIIDFITFWLWDLKEIFEEQSFLYNEIEIELVFSGSISEYSNADNVNNDSFDELMNVDVIGNKIKIDVSPRLYVSFHCSDNSRERDFFCYLMQLLSNFVMDDFDISKVEAQFNSNPKKQKICTLNLQSRYLTPISAKLIKVSSEYADLLQDEISDFVIRKFGLKQGTINDSEKFNVCKAIVDYLFKKLDEKAVQHDFESLINDAYVCLEKAMFLMMSSRVNFANELMCYPEKREQIAKHLNDLNNTSISAKALIEYVASQQNKGTRKATNAEFEDMLTICSEIVNWAHVGDLFRFNIINTDLNVLGSGRIGYDKTQVNQLRNINFGANEKRMIDISLTDGRRFSPSGILLEKLDEINSAFNAEYGYTFSQLQVVCEAILITGDSIENEIKRIKYNDLVARIIAIEPMDITVVKKIIDDLSLEKRNSYFDVPADFEIYDIYPWRFNRAYSFNRRPLIKVDDDVIWGNRQLNHYQFFISDLVVEGKLKAKNNELKSIIGTISNRRGKLFNKAVADRFKEFDFLLVAENVKKLNHKKIASESNNDIGDIDVLLINKTKKHIVLCELKDFGFSKTPYEMYCEYRNLFCDNGKKLCYISKHKKRIAWVNNHIEDVKAHFGLDDGKWTVSDVLIVNEPITCGEYYHKNQKIMLFSDIEAKTAKKL